MFKAIAPQCAQHESGYLVEVLDRNSIRYQDEQLTAVVQADFGPVTGLYVDTLEITARARDTSFGEEDRARVLSRIEAGMRFLGIRFEHAFFTAHD